MGAAAKDFLFDAGIDGEWQVSPVDEIVTDRVALVPAEVFWWVGLVEEMVSPLPNAKTIGVVQLALRIDVVVSRAIGVGGDRFTCLGEPVEHLVRRKLLALILERRGVGALGEFGRILYLGFIDVCLQV
jgi:hypothetical protein